MRFIVAILIQAIIAASAAAADCPQFAYGGMLPRAAEPHVVLCKKGFAVGYSTERRTPLWVAEVVDPENITRPTALESAPFRQDPTLSSTQQAKLADFAGGGFDRGHLVPFENVNHDVTAATESSYLTNIVPQFPANNRGIWKKLEELVRHASLNGKLFVVTGVIFEGPPVTIGSGVPVPSHLFKVIINPTNGTMVTYIIPNMDVPVSQLPQLVARRADVIARAKLDPVPVLSIQEK